MVQKTAATNFAARNTRARVWQPCPRNLISEQSISTNNSDRWMLFRHRHHLFDALGKDPIIAKHHFAVLTLRRDQAQRRIMIGDYRQELVGPQNSNPWIFSGIPFGHFPGSVCALIVQYRVVPILIGL